MIYRWRHGMLGAGLLFLSLPFLQGWTATRSTISIDPPRTSRDWKQLAAIEVETFDDFSPWEFLERKATGKFVLKQYVDSAKRLKGSKYALLMAIESSPRKVVGMVEMGVSRDAERNTTQAMVGVLCVSPKCQQRGIGALLLEKCEQVAKSEGWNETTLNVEVEPSNTAALRFFEKHGFVRLDEYRNVTVRRRRNYEERPHLLLSKVLSINHDGTSL